MSKHGFVVALTLSAAACGTTGPDDHVGETTEAISLSQTLFGLTVTMSSSGALIQGVDNTYTWTVQNTSTATIANITIASNWADHGGTSPVIKQLAPGCGTQSGLPLGVYCGTVTLAPGASATAWVKLQPQKAGSVAYNTYGTFTDSNGFNSNEVFDTESAAPGSVDLQITGSSNQGQPPVNSTYTYTFQVKNAGPWATSGGVTFSDPLPTSLALVSASSTTGSCTLGQTVTCALGDLANGAQSTISITVTAPSTAQQIVNTASASLTAPQSDTNTANNSVSVTVASH